MKSLLIIISLTIALDLTSQNNLVPDYSFEEYTRCPDGITQNPQRFPLKFWYLPTGGTPEYYNSCSDKFSNSVPLNKAGFQVPHSGSGYVGMTCSLIFSEYVQTKLKEPLIKDNVYCVEMWVSMANQSGRASEKIGVYFSKSKMSMMTFEKVLEVIPQVSSVDVIQDTARWIKVNGIFKAEGDEEFITVGSFASCKKEYIKIDYNKHSFFNREARYYIDDVCVKQIKEGEPCNCDEPELETEEPTKAQPGFELGKTITLPDITFASGKWELQANAKPLLDSLATYLQGNTAYKLTIEGHTDNVGKEEDNQTLSENRAKAVQEYLTTQGIKPERITVKGYGSTQPITDNNTESNRAKNRRVEIIIQE